MLKLLRALAGVALLAGLSPGCAAPTPPASAPTAASAPTRAPITFRQLLDRPRAQPTRRIAYGPDPLQFAELWLPEGRGPHPVIVLVHGGCWRADLPGVELMAAMSEDLRRSGVAVWNIEYRRLGHQGGGYPGTFADTAAAIDHLRTIARENRLDLRRVVFSGHSAGGHLALWAAARPRLPRDHPLRGAAPVRPRAAVTLAGINDLAAYRADGPAACGGPDTVDRLVGASGRAAPYADTSPAAMLPLRLPQTVLSGELDPIVPPRFGADYASAAARAGDPARAVTYPGAGHFELIDPTSAAWPQVKAELTAPLR